MNRTREQRQRDADKWRATQRRAAVKAEKKRRDRALASLRSGGGEPRATPTRKGLKRSGPIKPKKRTAKEKARIYGTADRIAWMKARPCVVPACIVESGCDIAHVVSGGMGRKSDASMTVPLCSHHHHIQHGVGLRAFEDFHGISLAALAAETDAAWIAHSTR